MFRNMNGNILLDVSADLRSSLFCDKASKSTDVNVFTLRQGYLLLL